MSHPVLPKYETFLDRNVKCNIEMFSLHLTFGGFRILTIAEDPVKGEPEREIRIHGGDHEWSMGDRFLANAIANDFRGQPGLGRHRPDLSEAQNVAFISTDAYPGFKILPRHEHDDSGHIVKAVNGDLILIVDD